nr:hypothetical protein [uncultured Blautia sp.]
MDENTKKELKLYIRNRQEIPEPMFDVHSILKCSDVEAWGKMCCERIAEEDLIDSKHVHIAWLDPGHIHVDAVGIIKCEDILRSFITEEDYSNLENYAWIQREHIRIKNQMLDTYREYSKDKLRELLKEVKGTDTDDKFIIEELIKEELHARRLCWRFYLRLKKWLDGKTFYIKNYRLFRAIRGIVKEIEAEEGIVSEEKAVVPAKNEVNSEKNAIYSAAFQRFLQKNKINDVEKLPEDKRKQYIFLGIKAYGVEYVRREKRPGTQGITNRYSELSKIMQSIGTMTPHQLQQIFPVKKDYDGDRYAMKDYYFTLHALEKAGMDKPIGSEMEAAHLLWDYQNTDIEFFLMAYMGCIEDIYIYEIDDRPFKEFYGKEV